jgi:hypothetical protein
MKLHEFRKLIREEVRNVLTESSARQLNEASKSFPSYDFNFKYGYFSFDPAKVSVSDMKQLKKVIDAAVKKGIVPKLERFDLVTDGMGMHYIQWGKPIDPKVAIQLGIYKQGQRKPRIKDDDYGETHTFTAQDKKDFKSEVMNVFKGASKGQNMTDEINDELGDYFEKISFGKDAKLKKAYLNLRGEIDGSVAKQAKYAKELLDLLK